MGPFFIGTRNKSSVAFVRWGKIQHLVTRVTLHCDPLHGNLHNSSSYFSWAYDRAEGFTSDVAILAGLSYSSETSNLTSSGPDVWMTTASAPDLSRE